MVFTENSLARFAAPPSSSENQQCLNAIKMVRDALRSSGFSDGNREIAPLFRGTYAYSLEMHRAKDQRKITILVQGSYANNTNVHAQSDVDIAVVQEELFLASCRCGQSGADYGFSSPKQPEKSFKDEIHKYLADKLGSNIKRGDKSIKVRGNTFRKDADTVPCIRYRDYRGDFRNDASNFVEGVGILTDSGDVIINYPELHIANGCRKNAATNQAYKKMVRITKNMNLLLHNCGYPSAAQISSFGLESLLWNIPDEVFMKYRLHGLTFAAIISYLNTHMAALPEFKEANGIKPLCPTQAAYCSYAEWISSLSSFFQYDAVGEQTI